jgi:hypothetical protein
VLAEGDKAPNFTLPDQNGEKVKLSDLKGEKVVLYYYPRARHGDQQHRPAITARFFSGSPKRLLARPIEVEQ